MTTIEATTGRTDVRGVFDSLTSESDYLVDEVDGQIPSALTGTLYRNGPGKNDVGGKPYGHLFDGDGMLSQFVISDGQVRYRNRFVRTEHFLGERAANEPKFRGFGTQRPGGVLANAFRLPANPANTSVTFHAGNLLALWEGGKPWRLDPDTLDTIGEYDYDGELKRMYTFSAHPKIDPTTGELFNFGVEYGPVTRIRTYRVDGTGRLGALGSFRLPYPVMHHDFALTERHLVFVINPVVLRMWRFLLGAESYDGALHYDPSKATRVVLVPRDGGKPRTMECEPFFHFHVNNAFEDGPDTVVDLARYEDFSIDQSLRNFSDADFVDRPLLHRLRISANGVVRSEPMSDWACEFPQHDWRRTTQPHRFAYAAATQEPGLMRAVLKVDNDTGQSWAHDFGQGSVAGEPIFVPRSPTADEDDGWLLSVVYSAAEHRSRLVVLDARNLEWGPVAEAHLRHHVPLGFHGTFTRRLAHSSVST